MKIALWLSIVCAALIIGGCSTNSGGTADQYNTTSSGTVEQTAPELTDPSLPQNPNTGPQMTPP